ncbi:hypothetical protein Godav_009956 [Gossypium davidsonii]|uniref:Aminotransferase-like plant mobile domain-containing protein n=1 Tax=Gossypium davidsonii TaxID=34287 RepID=A0A7J8SFQ4_GOSDV|nr:hypothetical protein [Gossypium davidsonii]
MKMVRVNCFIRNIPSPSSLLIENYLREAGFWHVANIGLGCKLDPKLISAFVERWRPETYIPSFMWGVPSLWRTFSYD